MPNIKDIKLLFIDKLLGRDEYVRKVNEQQYVTRCPHCLDSQKDFNTGHYYIRCNPDDNYKIVFNCFKCSSSGLLDEKEIKLLDIDTPELINGINYINRKGKKFDKTGISSGNDGFYRFDYKIPEEQSNLYKINYIRDRLKIPISEEDFKHMKIVTSLKDFMECNKLEEKDFNMNIVNTLEREYIGFLSNGASHILFRCLHDNTDYRWVKFNLSKDSYKNRVFYTMDFSFNPFSSEPIVINLCEGVLDAISIYKNLHNENAFNIAVGGKYYINIIEYLFGLGLIGSNVTINIYSDNDKDFNKKSNKKQNEDTSLEFYRKTFKDLKYLVKEINVYYNEIYKDYGTSIDKISLLKYRL